MSFAFFLSLTIVAVLLFTVNEGSSTKAEVPFDGKIKHMVVLMLENRSFDHMIGNMRKNRTDIDGCMAEFASNCSNPYDPTDPNSDLVFFNGDAVYIQPGDPHHSVENVRTQLFGPDDNEVWPPPGKGYVYDYVDRDTIDGDEGAMIMSGFTEETLPIMSTLVNNFGLSDRWFCGVPGCTEPNRLFHFMSTSGGMATNDDARLILGFHENSIFEMLDESPYGLNVTNDTWRVYFEQGPSALFVDYTRRHPSKFHFLDQFYKDVANNDLPIYTFLEPSYADIIFDGKGMYATDQHPDHDVTKGEALIKNIYESLRGSDLWNETLFIVTYDEHGGFFDHVPPPLTVSPDGKVANDVSPPFDFNRLGVRIPTIFISPWIPKGFMLDRPNPTENQYCASSVLHTLREQYSPNINPLTKRDEWSLTFEHILNYMDEPLNQGPKTLPNIPDSKLRYHKSITPETWIPGQQPVNDYQISITKTVCSQVNRHNEVEDNLQNQQQLGTLLIQCSKQWLNRD